jgi:hypothetical protein
MATFSSGSKYNVASHRMKIALWVARCKHPFSIIEDLELLEIFHDLNPNCITPSHYTVSRDIREILALSHTKVGEILKVSSHSRSPVLLLSLMVCRTLQAYPGKIHICADGWTSPNVIAFIRVTVHWIVDGRMTSVILDFIKYAFPLSYFCLVL